MSRRLALLSVSDKTDIEKLGAGLIQAGYTLLSTGGTARALRAAGLTRTASSIPLAAARPRAGSSHRG